MKLTDDSKLIKKLITNKLIHNLFSYLSNSYPNFYLCLLHYLSFYQHQWLGFSVWLFTSCNFFFFVSVNSFISCRVQFLMSCNILSFVIVNSFGSYIIQFFVSYNIQYQAFLFILNHSIGFIGNSKDLLDYLVGSRLLRPFYLHKAS